MRQAKEDAEKSRTRNPRPSYELDTIVVQKYFTDHDRQNPLHRKALALHLQAYRAARHREVPGETVCRLQHPQVLESVVDYRVLDACENLAILERKAASVRLTEAEKHVVAQIGTLQGHFLDDDESIDLHHLFIVRKNKAAEITELKNLVQFCSDLSVEKESDKIEALCNGEIPSAFSGRTDFHVFLQDFGELLVSEGEQARVLVQRVCADAGVARRVADDDDLPKPLRFLASLTLRTNGRDLHERERVVGFNAEAGQD